MSHSCRKDRCCSCGKKRDEKNWICTKGTHTFHKACLVEDMLWKFITSEKYLLLENDGIKCDRCKAGLIKGWFGRMKDCNKCGGYGSY